MINRNVSDTDLKEFEYWLQDRMEISAKEERKRNVELETLKDVYEHCVDFGIFEEREDYE